MAKLISAKQVEAAKARYERLGLQLENAKRKAGYSRSVKHGDIQSKKGRAFGEWQSLQAQYEKQS